MAPYTRLSCITCFEFLPDVIIPSGDVDLLAVLHVGVGPLLYEARPLQPCLDFTRVRDGEEVNFHVNGNGRRHLKRSREN